jgi:hypothetical protein
MRFNGEPKYQELSGLRISEIPLEKSDFFPEKYAEYIGLPDKIS